MTCPIAKYRTGNSQSSPIIACRISHGAYLLVWSGENNGRLNKICLLWTKLKNIAFPRVHQKTVQALSNIVGWVCRFTTGVSSTRRFPDISVSMMNMNEWSSKGIKSMNSPVE